MNKFDDSSQRCVLVVDDESAMRDAIVTLLDKEGYCCVEAADGVDALSVLSTQRNWEPMIVLIDIIMPRMNGMDLASALRRDFPDVPLVAVTAASDIYGIDDLLRAGFLAVITKPFRAEGLLKICNDIRIAS